jgi:motility quorum-sensing regulator / GCU-specific mRNA interferase toxin
MEKRKPHCPLSSIKNMIHDGQVRATRSALLGADALGLDIDGMLEVVLMLTLADFGKSMTTHGDNRIWQDVYKPSTSVGDVYLKLTVTNGVLVVSFKEC